MTLRQAYISSTLAAPFFAFPANQSVTNWITYAVPLLGSENFYSGVVDDTIDSVWLIFQGTIPPADKGNPVKVMDFSQYTSPTATGPNSVIIQLDNGGMPIVGGTVTLSLANTVVDWGTTDAFGRVSFLLAAGAYTVAAAATGFTAVVGYPVTVPLAVSPLLLPMTAKPIAPPPSCDVCECGTTTSTTPVTQLGAGCCSVDHNYGGLLNLAYRNPSCGGIAGAAIEVFDAVSYAAGNTASGFALLSTVTIAEGLWAAQFLLNDGNYVLRFEKPGTYGPDLYNLTVNCAANPPSSFVPSPVSPFGM